MTSEINKCNPMDLPLENGWYLIESSAGTGKTYTIEELYIRLIIEKGYTPKQILVVTYTEAATSELKNRIMKKLQSKCHEYKKNDLKNATNRLRLTLAIMSFDEAAIFTIHGFCQRMLSENAFESKHIFEFDILKDESDYIVNIVNDFWRKNFYINEQTEIANEKNDLYENLLEHAKKFVQYPDLKILVDSPPSPEQELSLKLKKEINKLLTKQKNEDHKISFNDLLINFHSALYDKTNTLLIDKIKKQFKAALIDEFQDTDKKQFEIFQKLFEKNKSIFYMIGDPKQSIYKFRGADIKTYIDVKNEIEPNHQYQMDKNYRSSQTLLDCVENLFKKELPFAIDKINFIKVSAGKENIAFYCDQIEDKNPLKLWYYKEAKSNNRTKICCDVAHEIKELLTSGKYTIKTDSAALPRAINTADIAVLTRDNKEAVEMLKMLQKFNIPAITQQSGNIFFTEEAQEFLWILKAIHELQEITIRRALISPLIGIMAMQLIEEPNRVNQESCYNHYYHFFVKLHELSKKSFIFAINTLLNKGDQELQIAPLRQSILQQQNGERKLTNILQLTELLHNQSLAQNCHLEGLIHWLSIKIQKEESEPLEEHELRLEKDDQNVQIMTIHKSKGLQFPIVFVPFINSRPLREENIFKNEKNEFCYYLMKENSPFLHPSLIEGLQEDLRLVYVAVTRASHCCYLGININKKNLKSGIIYLKTDQSPENFLQKPTLPEELSNIDPKDENLIIQIDPITKQEEFQNKEKFKCLEEPKIEYNSSILSFSSLAHQQTFNEEKDHDEISKENNISPLNLDSPKNEIQNNQDKFLYFDKGCITGTCIHRIFEILSTPNKENLSFQNIGNPNQINPHFASLIERQLKYFGFTSSEKMEQRIKQVFDGIYHTLNISLPFLKEPLTHISQEKQLAELEFFYPLTPVQLNQAIPSKLKTQKVLDKGMMTGFIDLIFEHQNKFWIVDWKTNFLGESKEDYNQENLKNCMNENNYNLQYHIYTIALHRYLKWRIPNYHYDTHLGGIFYLFVRGICDPQYGVFADRPDFAIIEEFNKNLGHFDHE